MAALQDYDDAYIVEYALQARGCVVSNDMYRDYIGAQEVLQRTVGYSRGTRCINLACTQGQPVACCATAQRTARAFQPLGQRGLFSRFSLAHGRRIASRRAVRCERRHAMQHGERNMQTMPLATSNILNAPCDMQHATYSIRSQTCNVHSYNATCNVHDASCKRAHASAADGDGATLALRLGCGARSLLLLCRRRVCAEPDVPFPAASTPSVTWRLSRTSAAQAVPDGNRGVNLAAIHSLLAALGRDVQVSGRRCLDCSAWPAVVEQLNVQRTGT